MKVAESPVFEKIKEQKQESKIPIIEAITKHPKNILIAMGARFAENGLFYVFTVFSLTYVATALKINRTIGLNGLLVAAFIATFAGPMWGALSDRIGRRPVYMWGAVACGILAFPFFALLGTKDPATITLAIVLPVVLGHAAMYGPAGQLLLRAVLGPGALQRRLPGLPAGLHLRRRAVAPDRHRAAGLRQGPAHLCRLVHDSPGGDHRRVGGVRQGDPQDRRLGERP